MSILSGTFVLLFFHFYYLNRKPLAPILPDYFCCLFLNDKIIDIVISMKYEQITNLSERHEFVDCLWVYIITSIFSFTYELAEFCEFQML